ncbi:Multidrug resistance-associated protein 4 [Stylophora pistillata]|uniref:Multidrug resistance-associated protein 4 n=1 Tax=Stylophora pistillata TaxID=50429 RepID=A0A2B4RW94_STYPI|nr:Multidrug resistance-associated protein 4 [Stylophora pistillata]
MALWRNTCMTTLMCVNRIRKMVLLLNRTDLFQYTTGPRIERCSETQRNYDSGGSPFHCGLFHSHAHSNDINPVFYWLARDEITLIRKKNAVLSIVASLEYASVPLAMMVSVITLVLTGQLLTPVHVFMLLCFINVARMSACFYVPYGFLDAYEAYVSLKRIEDFLLFKDLPRIEHKNLLKGTTDASQKGKSNLKRAPPYKQDIRVCRRDQLVRPDSLSVSILKSKENKGYSGFILQDIEFSTVSQGLAVITGSVGSGKSSLLLAITATATNPWPLFIANPVAVIIVYICKYYLKTCRQLKRLESINRSPVYSHISETLNGLETIRTRGRQRNFVEQFYRYQDVHLQSYITVLAGERWLGVHWSVLVLLLMCAVALSTILTSQDAALAGLEIAYIFLSFEQMAVSVRKTSEVESYMTSVERVITYTEIENEPGYRAQRAPPEHWPLEGNITFQDVSMRYYSRGPRVLKKVDLQIKGGMNVGVAGRTGAGKSSLVAALQRMPEAQGVIMIDNVPIKEINLQKTRRCISVLDQSPVLFSGSLRKNLDLMEQFRDQDLWRALEDVQSKELVERLEGRLDHQLLEHGANFSLGERQLICLARVLLDQSRIIIL